MLDEKEYTADRYCPVFGRVIDCEWCYDSVLGLRKMFNPRAIPELNEVQDLEKAGEICRACKYSNLE